jgi:hypothetical protein
MRPFLADGTLVPVAPPDRYRAGDVVLYGPPESSAIHRLYFRGADGWWIADDAATLPFHRVRPEDVRGRALLGNLPQGAWGLACGAACRLIYSVGRRAKRWLLHRRQAA